MTNEEFSNEFDVLVNNFPTMTVDGISNSPVDNVFTEYEKSVFLTQGQYQVVVNLYNGQMTGEPFETTEQQRRYLNELVVTKHVEKSSDYYEVHQDELDDFSNIPIDGRSEFYHIPNDILFISYEEIRPDSDDECISNLHIEVVPTTQDEMHRIRKDPFRGPNKRRALRLTLENDNVELISIYKIKEYNIRYIRRPKPIILQDLKDINEIDELEIDGMNTYSPCELNESIHRRILEAAVNLAMTSRRLSNAAQAPSPAQQQQQNNEEENENQQT